MTDQFLDYQLSKDFRDLDYDMPSFAYYTDDGILCQKSSDSIGYGIKKIDYHETITLTPLIQQAVEWLDGKGVFASALPDISNYKKFVYAIWIPHKATLSSQINYPTRREATIAAIKEAIIILKKKNHEL